MIKRYIVGAGIAGAFILAYGLVGNADIQEQERQAERYCKMVDAWHDSDGKAGWPPYDGGCEND